MVTISCNAAGGEVASSAGATTRAANERWGLQAVVPSVLFLGAVLCCSPLFAYEPPSQPEEQVLGLKRQRLKNHEALLAEDKRVIEMLSTFTDALPYTIACPAGKKVVVHINSRWNAWDSRKVKTDIGQGRVGACFVDHFSRGFVGDTKTVLVTYHVMLDPAITVQDEADATGIGQLRDETLLYHELLHGQLLINQIKAAAGGTTNWGKAVCACNFDDTPKDANHTTIYGWEEDYLAAIAKNAGKGAVVRHLPAQTSEGATGDFQVDLGSYEELVGEKETPVFRYRVPTGGNIVVSAGPPEVPRFVNRGGRLYLIGKLEDPKKEGAILVLIDPPGDFTTIGVEDAVVIWPANYGIPALSRWGLTLMAVLLLAAVVLVVRHRARLAL